MAFIHLIILAILVLVAEASEMSDKKSERSKFEDRKSFMDKIESHSYDFATYNSLEAIESFLKTLSDEHEDTFQLYTFGRSYEKRPMYAAEISSNWSSSSSSSENDTGKDEPPRKAILMGCGIHAREWPSITFCMYFINELVTGYKNQHKKVKRVLEKYDFIIMPVLNPDGYVYSMEKERMWRKNRSKYAPDSKCVGVDLNRNFDVKDKNDHNPCSDDYPGIETLSEPETASFVHLLEENSDRLKAYFGMHNYGNVWMTPWAKTNDRLPPHYEEMVRVGKIGVKALRKKFGTSLETGPAAELMYPARGTSLDYVYDKGYVDYSYVLELGDKKYSKTMIPNDKLLPMCEETTEGILQAILAMK